MSSLKPLTIETAPTGSQDTLKSIQKGYGFIPNLMATFANSPAVLNGYMSMDAAWGSSSLSAKERQIVLLATSVANHCDYCISAHSTILKGMMKVPAAFVDDIKARRPSSDAKTQALIQFTQEAVSERGYVSEKTKDAFLKAGFTNVSMMEVLVGVALKTISNYLDHLNPTPIDAAFQAEAPQR